MLTKMSYEYEDLKSEFDLLCFLRRDKKKELQNKNYLFAMGRNLIFDFARKKRISLVPFSNFVAQDSLSGMDVDAFFESLGVFEKGDLIVKNWEEDIETLASLQSDIIKKCAQDMIDGCSQVYISRKLGFHKSNYNRVMRKEGAKECFLTSRMKG